jgi:hypothetical protein
MRRKILLVGAVGVLIGVLFSAAVVMAGSLDPGAGPADAGSQMYTLEQIYTRLTSGGNATKMGAFTEPSSGPGSTMHTLDEIMAAAPAVDATNGAGVADVASGKTFWGLTSGQWGLQTGTASLGGTHNASVPRTGQNTSHAAGDDGALQIGVAWPNPRFTDNGDGTVTDNLTGLIWLKDANCASGVRTWATALNDVASLNSTGTMNGNNCGDISNGASHQTDWRLPNVREMQSLVHYGFVNPPVPNTAGTARWTAGNPFTNVGTTTIYWTSTTYAGSAQSAWYLDLGDGGVRRQLKTDLFRLWPVRGGQ